MSRLSIYGLFLSAYVPLLIRAQSVSESDEIRVTTIRSTITVVPVAYAATTTTYETVSTSTEEVFDASILPAPYPAPGGNDTIIVAPSASAGTGYGLSSITAYESSLSPPIPTIAACEIGKVTCPACDGKDISVEGGDTYKIYCDATLSSDTVIARPAYITSSQCLVICSHAAECAGTSVASNGSCSLVVGADYIVESSTTNDIAFVQVPYVSSNTSSSRNSSSPKPLASKFFSSATFTPKPYGTSYPNVTEPPILHLPKPIYTNFTWPNATYPTNTSLPLNNTWPNTTYPTNTTLPLNNTCTLTNPTCPACNNQTLVDSHNVTYTVLCGYSLDATLDWASAEPLPAPYCMARCDERNSTCFGASWSTEECVLALGDFVGLVKDPDHMAFVRAAVPQEAPYPAFSTRPTYTNISTYNGPQPTPTGVVATGQTFTETVVLPTETLVDYIPSTYPLAPRALPGYGNAPAASEAPEPTPVGYRDESVSEATAAPWRGSLPPWANAGGGDYGVDEGSRYHGPPKGSSWWKGGRPQWSHWGWGKPSWGHGQEQEHE